jgi:hypothetical protein
MPRAWFFDLVMNPLVLEQYGTVLLYSPSRWMKHAGDTRVDGLLPQRFPKTVSRRARLFKRRKKFEAVHDSVKYECTTPEKSYPCLWSHLMVSRRLQGS